MALKREVDVKLGHIELPCEDPKRTADFYCERLGFELEAVQGDRFFWLTRDQFSFLIRPRSAPDHRHNIVFYSGEADEAARTLKEAGIDVVLGTDHCHHFKDLDGHPLQIVDPEEDHSG